MRHLSTKGNTFEAIIYSAPDRKKLDLFNGAKLNALRQKTSKLSQFFPPIYFKSSNCHCVRNF